MKRTTKKLSLNKQSVRVLGQDELRAANGGTIIIKSLGCVTTNCSVFTSDCSSQCLPQNSLGDCI